MRQSTILLVQMLCAAAMLGACGGGNDTGSPSPAPTPAPSPSTTPTRVQKSLSVDGRARSYTLNLPAGYATIASLPLVIAMHGGGGSAAQFESTNGLTEKANASGFAVVYPDGIAGALGVRTWNAGTCCGASVTQQVDDVKFIEALIDDIEASWPIDRKRIHATGHSNGGMMSYRLACDLSARIASIAPNAAALVDSTCAPTRPVAVLHMHSKLDQNVPIAGGVGNGIAGVSFPTLDETINAWVGIDHCGTTPQVQVQPGRYTRSRWTGCNAGVEVELILTDDGGHAWPGGQPGSVNGDTPSTAISANDELWSFFQANRMPP